MESNQVKLASITDYDTLLEVAVESKVINKAQQKTLELWRKSPENWGA
jgi:orotate phosphoribosyltransferase